MPEKDAFKETPVSCFNLSGLIEVEGEQRALGPKLYVGVYNSIIAIKPLYNYNYDHYQVDRLTMHSSMLCSASKLTSHGSVGGADDMEVSRVHWP